MQERERIMRHCTGQDATQVRQHLPMKDSCEIEVEASPGQFEDRKPKTFRDSGIRQRIVSMFKAAPRIWPSSKHDMIEESAELNSDMLLKKFSIPSEVGTSSTDNSRGTESSMEGRKRFAFSQGIPIKGSDANDFSHSLHHQLMVNPEGRILFVWLIGVSVAWLYSVWALIARQAFRELRETKTDFFWFILDYSCDFIYLLDIVVQFRTGFLENGLLVCQASKLARHYLLSRHFVLDVACLMPTDLLYLISGSVQPLYRFPRFLKGYRAKHFYRKAESATSYPNVLRVIFLGHTLMLLMHWFACFYFMISESEDFYTPPDEQRGWAYPLPKGNNASEWSTLRRKYLHSIYWACLTLTTIGEKQSPTTDLEYICTLAAYFLGIFVFATVVGQVGNVIANKNANRLEFERMVDNAKTFMKTKNVPKEMQTRVLRWYDYSWSRGTLRGSTDVNRLGMMPDTLKVELAIQVNLTTLRKVSIFRLVQPEFLYHLVLKMKSCIYTPGDLICRQGEVAREMFIISHGILEVVSESGTIMARLKSGDFFGEIGILNIMKGVNKRVANVRSVGYSEVFTLDGEDVLQAMEYYPEAKRLLLLYGRQRLEESSQHPGSDAHELVMEEKMRSMKIRESIASITSKRSGKERPKSSSVGKKRIAKLANKSKSFSGRSLRGGAEMLAASVASSIKFDERTNVFVSNCVEAPPEENNLSDVTEAHKRRQRMSQLVYSRMHHTLPEKDTIFEDTEDEERRRRSTADIGVMGQMQDLLNQMQSCLDGNPNLARKSSVGSIGSKMSCDGDVMQLINMQKDVLAEEKKKVNSLQEDIKLLMEKLENTMNNDEPMGKSHGRNLQNSKGKKTKLSIDDSSTTDNENSSRGSKTGINKPVHSRSLPHISNRVGLIANSISDDFVVATKTKNNRTRNRWPILSAAVRLRKPPSSSKTIVFKSASPSTLSSSPGSNNDMGTSSSSVNFFQCEDLIEESGDEQ